MFREYLCCCWHKIRSAEVQYYTHNGTSSFYTYSQFNYALLHAGRITRLLVSRVPKHSLTFFMLLIYCRLGGWILVWFRSYEFHIGYHVKGSGRFYFALLEFELFGEGRLLRRRGKGQEFGLRGWMFPCSLSSPKLRTYKVVGEVCFLGLKFLLLYADQNTRKIVLKWCNMLQGIDLILANFYFFCQERYRVSASP